LDKYQAFVGREAGDRREGEGGGGGEEEEGAGGGGGGGERGNMVRYLLC